MLFETCFYFIFSITCYVIVIIAALWNTIVKVLNTSQIMLLYELTTSIICLDCNEKAMSVTTQSS